MVAATFEYIDEAEALEMKVHGHAGAGPEGFDLVCASVSGIAVGIAQVISDMGKDGKFKKKPTIAIRKGYVKVVAKPKNEHFAETLHTFFVGEVQLGLLAQVYPQFITLQPFTTAAAGDE